jgi:PhoPQ-activated pathogenicity-related protein
MARSVVAALDLLQDRTGIERFVVTGASKRGWACWLAAATGDPRIVGIAPRVFDNLDLAGQAAKQAEDWGGYSPMVDDYSRRSLQALAETPEGQALLDLVDPVRMLGRVTAPQLLVHGANDPYWTVDALSLYWDKLKDARAVIVPNEGHGLAPESGWMEALAAFVVACDMGTSLPEVATVQQGPEVEVLTSQPGWGEVWGTDSDGRRFDQCRWRKVSEGRVPGQLPCRQGEYVSARLVRAWFQGPAGPYALSAPVRVSGQAPIWDLSA